MLNGLEGKICREFVRYKFGGEELGDAKDFCTGYSQEKGDGVEDVADDEFKGQVVNSETASNPSEQAVYAVDTGQSQQ